MCACALCRFIASDWAWLHEPMLGHQGVGLGQVLGGCGGGGGGAWQEVKGEATPVNEALYAGVISIERTVQPDGS